MTPVAEILAQLGGWATFGDLRKITGRRALAGALARGDVVRPARGIYCHPQLADDRSAAAAHTAVLSHTSAALAWGLPLLVAPPKAHLTIPTNRNARPGPPAVLHWADLPAADLRRGRTSLERTVLDCARILPFGEALAIADAALATGRLTAEELQAAALRSRGRGRPNVVRVGSVADRRSESFLESVLRGVLLSAGIERFEPQVLVGTPGGRARVDLGDQVGRIALEAEGYEFHGTPAKFADDCRRYDELVSAGWLVLRFTYQHVLGDPDWVVDTVRSAIAQRADERVIVSREPDQRSRRPLTRGGRW
ncbi:DUF559 domain-containing protein [Kribbella sandramycini]|uniref:DUF559 domain-containing protein n=1 Tax=Kribbella sandramycini TaxID=60450 RepID=A0A7Y4KZK2_9ACTN|nr:DUF559 domain-containing protein [Kribbella sandramycini]MBB6569334.1 very-short-patch-repair endonuclease [Kribbella sandramycini]NOL40827.1 DUF559 domain-containing protein [Kribbella sandramycini]